MRGSGDELAMDCYPVRTYLQHCCVSIWMLVVVSRGNQTWFWEKEIVCPKKGVIGQFKRYCFPTIIGQVEIWWGVEFFWSFISNKHVFLAPITKWSVKGLSICFFQTTLNFLSFHFFGIHPHLLFIYEVLLRSLWLVVSLSVAQTNNDFWIRNVSVVSLVQFSLAHTIIWWQQK